MTIKNINVENHNTSRMTELDYLFKISVIADKQESIEAFAQDILPEPVDLGNAPGLEYLVKNISINEHKIARLHFWLLSCKQTWKSIRRMHVIGSNGIILIFDSTDNKSLEIISEQIALVRNEIPKVPF